MLTEQLINWLMNESNTFPPNSSIFYEIINKLERAKKVEELLEMYHIQRKTTTFENWHKRNNRIDDLEKELEVLKNA